MSAARNTTPATVARLVAAVAVLVGGLVHFQLYFDGYRNLPDANLGRSFVANGVASVLVAVLLVVRRDSVVRLAGIAVSCGTLGAFAMSRRGDGIFGLRETGLEPSPQALLALVVELTAVVLLVASFLPAVGPGPALPRRVSFAAAGVMATVSIAAALAWSQTATAPAVAASEPGSVVIAGFAFQAPQITVATGSTVTWTNTDGFAHSVVAADRSFESDRLPTGASFTTTFAAAGTFTYICGIHPSMTGTVVVTG